MSAQVHVGSTPADEKPGRALLDAIACVHPLALLVDSEGQVVWLSDRFANLCSEGSGVIGRNLREALPMLARPEQSFEMLQQLTENGAVLRAPVDLVDHFADQQPLEISLLPLGGMDETGPFQLVTARVRDEVQQCGSDHAILESLPDAVLCVDADGFLIHLNAAAEQLLGRPREALLGVPAALLAADVEQLERLMVALKTDGVSQLDLTVRAAGHQKIPVGAHVSPHSCQNGAARGAIVSLRDASQRHATEHELGRRNDELEHCVATLAHDLRSPLVALLGFSRLLRQDFGDKLDDTGTHFIERIEQAGRTMEALIHDLLELSRIGHPGERPTIVDARTVLIQLAAELKPRLDAADITLELIEDPPHVYCDRTRLYQIFSNLIGNAIEHMGDEGDRRIQVDIIEEAACHRLSVRDFGRGIALEHHEKIFEVFHSLERRREGHRGSGMGLTIVRKIAETHDGRAWVESEPGQGAIFYVTLPRH